MAFTDTNMVLIVRWEGAIKRVLYVLVAAPSILLADILTTHFLKRTMRNG
jgi:hypothetical protein